MSTPRPIFCVSGFSVYLAFPQEVCERGAAAGGRARGTGVARGQHMANTWQGAFPQENLRSDGYERPSPVGAYPPNRNGLVDMIGNVWEWTTDWWSSRHARDPAKACCVPQNPRGGPEQASYDPRQPEIRDRSQGAEGRFASLCTELLRRYRPAARHAHPMDTSTSHIGFRGVARRPLEV